MTLPQHLNCCTSIWLTPHKPNLNLSGHGRDIILQSSMLICSYHNLDKRFLPNSTSNFFFPGYQSLIHYCDFLLKIPKQSNYWYGMNVFYFYFYKSENKLGIKMHFPVKLTDKTTFPKIKMWYIHDKMKPSKTKFFSRKISRNNFLSKQIS